MAILALHSSSTGLSALATELDVLANNLANVNTTAFKGSRANFENLLYQAKSQPGVENADGSESPAGLFVGLGTRVSNTQFDFSQGNAIQSSGDFDVMINGDGFFRLEMPSIGGDGIVYSRAGTFTRNADGELVLANSDGLRLEGGVVVPGDATDIQISSNGIISYIPANQTQREEAGQIQISTFVNKQGLKPLGGNVYSETDASGPPITGEPNQGVFGQIMHKYLESSNVDPVNELVRLIKTQRAFEMNSKTVQAADEALQITANLRRF